MRIGGLLIIGFVAIGAGAAWAQDKTQDSTPYSREGAGQGTYTQQTRRGRDGGGDPANKLVTIRDKQVPI